MTARSLMWGPVKASYPRQAAKASLGLWDPVPGTLLHIRLEKEVQGLKFPPQVPRRALNWGPVRDSEHGQVGDNFQGLWALSTLRHSGPEKRAQDKGLPLQSLLEMCLGAWSELLILEKQETSPTACGPL
ncbi:hypothetical protein NDU88_003009 [Pleurodeles waltl]|uniref:Uncharacterized protein n=1 Tax=Pleurodeles waltl TaxID=8319 RepID=A0AAV7SCJ6_PLEWA|nr:hypothetical protein NDU88_003009 [Pleurodeles waltl]